MTQIDLPGACTWIPGKVRKGDYVAVFEPIITVSPDGAQTASERWRVAQVTKANRKGVALRVMLWKASPDYKVDFRMTVYTLAGKQMEAARYFNSDPDVCRSQHALKTAILAA